MLVEVIMEDIQVDMIVMIDMIAMIVMIDIEDLALPIALHTVHHIALLIVHVVDLFLGVVHVV